MSEMGPIAAVGLVHELLYTPVNAESTAFEHQFDALRIL
jgi:hypothetical protein